MDSSNYTINSIWLSEQQVAQMCNFDSKHQRYLAAMQYKIREDYLTVVKKCGSLHFLQQSLHKVF